MSADEMFDELGYKKIHDNKRRIVFKIKDQWIAINMNLDILELQAINKKCQELGWI